MFERFTEKARRVVFFARYEASQFGSPYIETEHLLLGLTREDGPLRMRLSQAHLDPESLRKQISSRTTIREKISTSVDLPLSSDLKRALAYASEEALALQQRVVDSGHLVLGLLRIENCFAAALLQQGGITYEGYREVVRTEAFPEEDRPRERLRRQRPVERPWHEPQQTEPAAPSLRHAITALKELLDRATEHIDMYSEAYGEQRLKRKTWSRKEALGYLIDLATAHHQWFARALLEPKLIDSAYPQEEWVQAQGYRSLSWPDVVDSWICLNRLLLHVLLLIPEEKVNMSCRIGVAEPIPLLSLIEQYVERSEDIVGQILSRL